MTFEGWTVEDVLELAPCELYDEARIRELWAGRERLGIAEVCDLPVPAHHRIWLLCHAPWEVIEPAITAIVERAVMAHGATSPQPCALAERCLSEARESRDSAWRAWWARQAAEAAVEAVLVAAADAAEAAVLVAGWGRPAWGRSALVAENVERERQIQDFRRLAQT